MNILADENIEFLVISRLRADGHVVTAIAETSPGVPDTEVLQLAVQLQVLLLTSNKDFGDLLFLRRLQSPLGIILLRLPETITTAQKAVIVSGVLRTYAAQLAGAFTVVSPSGVRIIPLPTPNP
jgi:predicted nuclease of predicted toxin-antitoxin system